MDSSRTDYYTLVLEGHDMTEIDSSLMELEERVAQLVVSFNLLLNSYKNETQFRIKFKNCKITLPEIPLTPFSGQHED